MEASLFGLKVDSALQGSAKKQKAPKRRGEGKQSWQWNPLKEGSWHPDFDVDAMKVEAAKQAVQEAEAKRAAESGSGSADEEDAIKTGASSAEPSPIGSSHLSSKLSQSLCNHASHVLLVRAHHSTVRSMVLGQAWRLGGGERSSARARRRGRRSCTAATSPAPSPIPSRRPSSWSTSRPSTGTSSRRALLTQPLRLAAHVAACGCAAAGNSVQSAGLRITCCHNCCPALGGARQRRPSKAHD